MMAGKGRKRCTASPTDLPTRFPTDVPTNRPTAQPTPVPTQPPTMAPTSPPSRRRGSVPRHFWADRAQPDQRPPLRARGGREPAVHVGSSPRGGAGLTCCGAQGHLASIGEASERDFFESAFQFGTGWVAFTDKDSEGTYVWTDGTPFDATLSRCDLPFVLLSKRLTTGSSPTLCHRQKRSGMPVVLRCVLHYSSSSSIAPREKSPDTVPKSDSRLRFLLNRCFESLLEGRLCIRTCWFT